MEKINLKDFERWVDNEISFLRYYGNYEKNKLDINCDFYKDIKEGWYKRPLKLRLRCASTFLKSKTEINPNTKIGELENASQNDGLTPLEIFVKIYPERKKEVISILKSEETNPNTRIII